MSTSLLYHSFGINGYDYVNTKYKNGAVIFKIMQRPHKLCCSVCGCRKVIRRGKVNRMFRSLPIGNKPVWIVLPIQRVFCIYCKLVRQVKVNFADTRCSYTKAFKRYALQLCQSMTMLDVARHLGVTWDVIKNIQKCYLAKHFAKPKLKKIEQIAIDEMSIGKGHRYLTVVLNLKTGVVLFVGEGKGADALKPFFKRLKRSRSKVKAVAIDMSPAYIAAVIENLPKAKIVFDHFHVIKLYNEKLSQLRRELHSEASGPLQKKVLKASRWLVLKNPENLDHQKNQHKRLEQALELNKPLATAYYLKEELRQLWNQPNKEQAEKLVKSWIAKAESSSIAMLNKFAKTLAFHKFGILSHYDYRISTGPLEGTNNKIKTMKRQAYGFRDMEFFKLKILAIHNTKYALLG